MNQVNFSNHNGDCTKHTKKKKTFSLILFLTLTLNISAVIPIAAPQNAENKNNETEEINKLLNSTNFIFSDQHPRYPSSGVKAEGNLTLEVVSGI